MYQLGCRQVNPLQPLATSGTTLSVKTLTTKMLADKVFTNKVPSNPHSII